MRTERDSRVYNIVMTAMMMCIVMVSILLLRVPIPFTQGYVNLSDAMVFMAVILLGALGLLPPAVSALLHNSSTLLLSMNCMSNLMPEAPAVLQQEERRNNG